MAIVVIFILRALCRVTMPSLDVNFCCLWGLAGSAIECGRRDTVSLEASLLVLWDISHTTEKVLLSD